MAVNLIDSTDIEITQTGNNIQLSTTVDMQILESNVETNTSDIENLQNGNVYSTDEVDTGKIWIDGKKIYRKVINITSGMSTSFNVPHNIANVDYLEIASANIFSSSTNNSPIYYYSNTDYFRVFRNGDNISIRYGSGVSPVRIVITLEYTKTTN